MKKPGDVFVCELKPLIPKPRRYMAGYVISYSDMPRKIEESPFKAAVELDKLIRQKYGITDTLVKLGLQHEEESA